MNHEYPRPAPDELANMMRSGCSPYEWRHKWHGTPWAMAADYLEQLALSHKANQVLSILQSDSRYHWRVTYNHQNSLLGMCMLSRAEKSCNQENPYNIIYKNVYGYGKSFEESVLDAASNIDHDDIQAILKSNAMMSSLP